jgi:thiol-disulfide isomerase/thioredoxin
LHQRDKQYARSTAISCAAVVVVALAVNYWPTTNPLRWQTFGAARAESRELNKPLFLDVYAEWCVPCKNMDRFVFPADSVKEILNSKYALARVNIDDPVLGDSIRKMFNLRGVPTYIILTPGGRERKRYEGFFPKSSFIQWLADSSQLAILSWLEFRKAEAKAAAEDKRLMVLMAKSKGNLASLNGLFETPDAFQLIDSLYVPTLLVKSTPGDDEILNELGGNKIWQDEVVVLEDGIEVGRFTITPDMKVDTSALVSKLYDLGRKKSPLNLNPQKRIKKIS